MARPDYEGMMKVYENIIKQRPLHDFEQKRYDIIVDRCRRYDKQAIWRQENKVSIRERDNKWRKETEKGKACAKRASQAYEDRNRQARNAAKRAYWAANPDKYEAAMARRKLKRQQVREAKAANKTT